MRARWPPISTARSSAAAEPSLRASSPRLLTSARYGLPPTRDSMEHKSVATRTSAEHNTLNHASSQRHGRAICAQPSAQPITQSAAAHTRQGGISRSANRASRSVIGPGPRKRAQSRSARQILAGLASRGAPEWDVLRGEALRVHGCWPAAVAVHITISRPPLWSRFWRLPQCRTSSVRRGRGPGVVRAGTAPATPGGITGADGLAFLCVQEGAANIQHERQSSPSGATSGSVSLLGGRFSRTRGFSVARRSPRATLSSGSSQKNVSTQLL